MSGSVLSWWREPLFESLEITGIVFVLMVVVELLNIRLQGRLESLLSRFPGASYFLTALLGVIPGCEGEFLTVTLYAHGVVSFGAVVACMVATTGDEGLTMLSMVPRATLVLFGLMLAVAVLVGWFVDRLRARRSTRPRLCAAPHHHPGHEGVGHFVREHLVRHLLIGHIPKIFLWTFGALLAASLVSPWLGGADGAQLSRPLLLLVAATVGLIPSSGPHLLFVSLFAKGAAPFSVLAASSFSQTGHGVLPLFHTSVRDVLLIKAITFLVGLTVGGLLMVIGW